MTIASPVMEELYEDTRSSLDTDVFFTVIGSDHRGTGATIDLNTKRLLFETDNELLPGMLLDMTVICRAAGTTPLRTTVSVSEVTPKEGGKFEIFSDVKSIE